MPRCSCLESLVIDRPSLREGEEVEFVLQGSVKHVCLTDCDVTVLSTVSQSLLRGGAACPLELGLVPLSHSDRR